MPGAWELLAAYEPRTLCAVLHVDTVTFAWSLGLRNLRVPGGMVVGLNGMPYDHARNAAAMRAIEVGAEYLFFLDSDVIPPPDAILRLAAHRKPIVSGLYCRRSPPVGVPVMLKDGNWIQDFRDGELLEVDLVGAGCLLISTQLLKSLPPQRPGKHWFDWRVDMASVLPQGQSMSEDFTFCEHVRRHGVPILVDTSVKCLHVGYSQCSRGEIQPLVA